MGEQTSISWCHHTFNIVIGCTKVSEACHFCYAEAMSKRMGLDVWGPNKPRKVLSADYWKAPLKWDRIAAVMGERRRVFCSSMADVFEDHPTVAEQRLRLWPLIERTPNLDWLLLTKRPENIGQFIPESGLAKNVWLMTTIEKPEYLSRADWLKAIPATVHGLSMEPLLADFPTFSEHADGIDFVIVGGESGPNHRPLNMDHVRRLRDECLSRGIAFHFKQVGGRLPNSNGCLLDGVEYKQFPKAA